MRYAIFFVSAALLISLASEATARGPGGGGGPGGGPGGMGGSAMGGAGCGGGMQGNMSAMSGGMMSVSQAQSAVTYADIQAYQMQQAYARQQYAIAAAEAAKKAERREKIRQSIIARKQQEDAKELARRSPGEQFARQ